MINFYNITKTYNGDTKAVDDISFNVPEGETVVLLGPSGCGKTTLLRMVNRLISSTSGTISVNNQPINSLDKIELRRKIGYVIQSNGLFPNMTIERNIMVVPELLGWDKGRKRKRYNELMGLMGMDADHFRSRYPHELSGGQQQRIGIARAMAADPPVLLMDEPFGALDPILRNRIQDEFLQIQREVNKTILFVSHDIDEAIKMGDKVAIFNSGKLVQYDRPTEILARPNSDFVAKFVGNDRALKSLSLHLVKDLVASQTLLPADVTAKDSKPINLNSNLKNALSILLNQEAEQLVVLGNDNSPLGAITYEQIVQYMHHEIKGEESELGVTT
ncbi:ABC transporter ATP-binding protein [Virgibacillus sp. L01]|uniref:ABC transporter ATP-binding protein n=1 Tax=Virgibacillus sp. L01 TaxID=3457429 RepID=UPI003FD4BFE2